MECSYVTVIQCGEIFNDIYKRSVFPINGRSSFDSQHISASRIFRQSNNWVINRVGFEIYLMTLFNSELFPISNSWNQTNQTNLVGNHLPNCKVACRSNLFPTTAPSFNPSVPLTNLPTFQPSTFPTLSPSFTGNNFVFF
jgi:hypothetical protein